MLGLIQSPQQPLCPEFQPDVIWVTIYWPHCLDSIDRLPRVRDPIFRTASSTRSHTKYPSFVGSFIAVHEIVGETFVRLIFNWRKFRQYFCVWVVLSPTISQYLEVCDISEQSMRDHGKFQNLLPGAPSGENLDASPSLTVHFLPMFSFATSGELGLSKDDFN